MKRVPSFSARPGFPSGLQVRRVYLCVLTMSEFSDCTLLHAQVLLVEADKQSREKVSRQLRQLSYVGKRCEAPRHTYRVAPARPKQAASTLSPCYSSAHEFTKCVCAGTCCSNSGEADDLLSAQPGRFDIVLAEVSRDRGCLPGGINEKHFAVFWLKLATGPHTTSLCLQAKTVAHDTPAFVAALDGMPLVLMSEGGSANQVWKSIELGAVEYLEKPLSQLKLRNIWQHVVRKVRLPTTSTHAALCLAGHTAFADARSQVYVH